MIKIYKHIILIVCLILLFGCPDKIPKGDIAKIKINNNSVHTISVYKSYIYPDTSMSKMSDINCYYILPNETCNAGTRHGWKQEVRSNELGIIIFFISDNDTIEKYGVDVWKDEYLILERLELTESDLENMNWTITYP